MVARQLAGRGIRDCRVLAAMGWVPREWFLPPHLASEAYEDAPLPIGSGQTISQPLIVALRSEEHTSELQSRLHLVCRLLLEKKKKTFYSLLVVFSSTSPSVVIVLVPTSNPI